MLAEGMRLCARCLPASPVSPCRERGPSRGPSRGLRGAFVARPSCHRYHSPHHPRRSLSSASPRLSHRPAPAGSGRRIGHHSVWLCARAGLPGIHVPNSDAIGGCPRPPLPPSPPIRPSCCVVSKITPSGSSVEEGVEMLYSLGARDWAPAHLLRHPHRPHCLSIVYRLPLDAFQALRPHGFC